MKNVSDAEWKVMKVLWSKSPMFASEIVDELKDSTEWNPKTIHTLLRRLVAKGAVTTEKDGNFYKYFAEVSENECIKEEAKSFLKKCFNGSLNLMFANFIEEHNMSDEEIEELEKLLNSKKK